MLGGWQVGWILDYEAGVMSTDISGSHGPYESEIPLAGTQGNDNRPNRVQGVSLKTASYTQVRNQFKGTGPIANVFNPAAFAPTPTQYVLGNALRNYGAIRNPALYNESANIRKRFFFGDRFQGILQVDYFNLLNRTQFNGPDVNVLDGTFGQVINQGSQISNRQGEAQFRLEF